MNTPSNTRRRAALRALLLATAACTAASPPESAKVSISQSLPALDGSHLEISLVEVTYGPSAHSAPHHHRCPVIVYVLEGAYRSQVRGGPATIYQAGESFYEPPNGVHEISANASDRKPVRFLATFLCDRAGARTTPEPAAGGSTQP